MVDSWDTCFLALAYGEPRQLLSKIEGRQSEGETTIQGAARIMGIGVDHVDTIVEWFGKRRFCFGTQLLLWLRAHEVPEAEVLAVAKHAAVKEGMAWRKVAKRQLTILRGRTPNIHRETIKLDFRELDPTFAELAASV